MEPQTWQSVSESYRLYLVTKAYSGETIKTYLAYASIPWHWFSLRERCMLDVSAREVATFLAEAARTHKRYTVRNFTCALRAFFVWTIAERLRDDNPTTGMSLRKPKLQPKRPFSLDELRALLDAASAPVDLAMVLLLMDGGVRIGELVRLRVQDIDRSRAVALLYGKGSKERWISITPRPMAALLVYVGGRTSGPAFLNQDGRPMSRERARKRLMALGERAGVVNVYPHRFRTTFANHFLVSGGDLGALQVAMGHEDVATTARYAGYSQAQRALDQMRQFSLSDELAD